MKTCYLCNKFVGLDNYNIWHSYLPLQEDNDYSVLFCYICTNCNIYLNKTWTCVYCLNKYSEYNHFCDSIRKGSQTCLYCLHKYRENNKDELYCNCNICKKINKHYQARQTIP
jgi:hypothetical protein